MVCEAHTARKRIYMRAREGLQGGLGGGRTPQLSKSSAGVPPPGTVVAQLVGGISMGLVIWWRQDGFITTS